jgi:hypothetical protein
MTKIIIAYVYDNKEQLECKSRQLIWIGGPFKKNGSEGYHSSMSKYHVV